MGKQCLVVQTILSKLDYYIFMTTKKAWSEDQASKLIVDADYSNSKAATTAGADSVPEALPTNAV